MKISSEQLVRKLQERDWLPEELAGSAPEAFVEGEGAGGFALLEALVEQGWLNQEQAIELLGEETALPVAWSPATVDVDPEFLNRIPMEYARKHRALPVRRHGEEILVWISDPAVLEEIQNQLSFILGAPVTFLLVPPGFLERAIHEVYYRHSATSESEIRKLEKEEAKSQQQTALFAGETEDLLDMANRAPIVRLVNLILLEAVKSGASDVHFEPYEESLKVRFRIDGVLTERSAPPPQHRAALISRLKVMSGLNIAERRLPQDGRARIRIGGRELDIRVSSVPVRHGERLVLRILDRENQLRDLGELGMPEGMQTRFEEILGRSHGLVLVTGPTGSGKTTTIYGALDRLDCQRQNIITIEDPVEYQVPSVSQIEIRPQIGLTFAHGLRHILRQDPDVVMVGEMRDLETAEISIRASLTGHLVLSTLHTNSSLEAIIRLQDMGIPRYLIAAASIGTMAQRLVRRLCPQCKIRDENGKSVLPQSEEALFVFHAREEGCSACIGGYRGRIGIFEFLDWDETFRNLVHDGASARELRDHLVSVGFASMSDDAGRKVRQGVTSPEEVWRVF